MSTLSDIGGALAQIAPTIAGLFLGPLGATGVQAAEAALGITSPAGATTDARKQAVLSALQGATPEQIVALKQADNDLKKKLVDGGVQVESISAADRSDARKRQVDMKDHYPAILMSIVSAGFFGLLWFLATSEVPAGNKEILDGMLGSLGTVWVMGATFYFGTTSGSADKNKLLGKAIDMAAQP